MQHVTYSPSFIISPSTVPSTIQRVVRIASRKVTVTSDSIGLGVGGYSSKYTAFSMRQFLHNLSTVFSTRGTPRRTRPCLRGTQARTRRDRGSTNLLAILGRAVKFCHSRNHRASGLPVVHRSLDVTSRLRLRRVSPRT